MAYRCRCCIPPGTVSVRIEAWHASTVLIRAGDHPARQYRYTVEPYEAPKIGQYSTSAWQTCSRTTPCPIRHVLRTISLDAVADLAAIQLMHGSVIGTPSTNMRPRHTTTWASPPASTQIPRALNTSHMDRGQPTMHMLLGGEGEAEVGVPSATGDTSGPERKNRRKKEEKRWVVCAVIPL